MIVCACATVAWREPHPAMGCMPASVPHSFNCSSSPLLTPPQALQARVAGLRYLIVDEISMVSAATLLHMHRRLTEATGVQAPYGNVSMVFVGDFFQLPPGACSAVCMG